MSDVHTMPPAQPAGPPTLSRRRLLKAGAGGAAMLVAAACAPAPAAVPTAAPAKPTEAPKPAASPIAVPPQVKPVPKELFYNFGSNHEMRWETMARGGFVVPNEQFFLRTLTRTPSIDVSTWRLKIEGSGVERPLELTYDELLDLPSVSFIRYIECAGNGRSFFDTVGGKKAEGTQWKLGAIGVAEWTGVPLREVLERARVKQGAVHVMPEGLDERKVRRPIPLGKAMEEDTLLVYAMNGQPLPPDHGFPVRALVPGWIGVSSIKWVGRIEVADQPLTSPWNTESYVMIGPDYEAKPPAKGPALSTQNVKSALELAWPAELKAGQRTIRGRSWSPFGKIAKVEYSLDEGKSWQTARLQQPNIARAWARWEFPWEARPGKYGLRVRATDEKGNGQPESVTFNQQGYLYNAVVSHPVNVA